MMVMLYILIGLQATQMYAFSKTHVLYISGLCISPYVNLIKNKKI